MCGSCVGGANFEGVLPATASEVLSGLHMLAVIAPRQDASGSSMR